MAFWAKVSGVKSSLRVCWHSALHPFQGGDRMVVPNYGSPDSMVYFRQTPHHPADQHGTPQQTELWHTWHCS